jgi:hypothetical protein
MATASTAPAWKAVFLAQLAADSRLSTVQVVSTYPEEQLASSAMYWGDIDIKRTIPVVGGGRVHRAETFDVELFIDCSSGGPLVDSAETQCYELMSVVDDDLANDVQQGQLPGTSTGWVWKSEVTGATGHPYKDTDRLGWAFLLKLTISVNARLK